MALPESVRKQAEFADKFYQGNTDQPQGEPTPQPKAEGIPPESAPVPAPQATPVNDEKDYRQMYIALKGKYDKEVPTLHSQVRNLTEQANQSQHAPQNDTHVAQLNQQIADLEQRNRLLEQSKVDTAPHAESTIELNAHLIEEYGQDFAQAVADQSAASVKAANAENRKMQKRLNSIESQFSQSSKDNKLTTLRNMLSGNGVSLDDTETDHGFGAWLQTVDSRSGQTLSTLLHQAFNNGDLQRTASFYMDYNATQSRPNQTQLSEYADNVTNNPASESPNQTVFDPSAFTRLAEQLRTKQITHAEYDKQERLLFTAMNRPR